MDNHNNNLPIPISLLPIYSNATGFSFNKTEFVCCFGLLLGRHVSAHTVVVLTPVTAKLMQQTLDQSISRYEEQFGKIEIPEK